MYVDYAIFLRDLVASGLAGGLTADDAAHRAIDAVRWLRGTRNRTGVPAIDLRVLLVSAMSSPGGESGAILAQRALEAARILGAHVNDYWHGPQATKHSRLQVRDAKGLVMRTETPEHRQQMLDDALMSETPEKHRRRTK